jgi:hypothetical protein
MVQSIAGVGILVIGTPILLTLQFNIIEVLSILLPISITTSLLNYLFFKIKKNKIKIDINLKKLFVFICVPSIFLGLLVLKNFGEMMNFKFIVAGVIIGSVILSIVFKKKTITNYSKVIFLISVGFVHGLTNSGGSLLSLLLSSQNKKNYSRYNITFFYLFLALFQYIIFLIIFNNSINKDYYNIKILFIIIVASLIGNFFVKYLNDKFFKILINILAIIASVALISFN